MRFASAFTGFLCLLSALPAAGDDGIDGSITYQHAIDSVRWIKVTRKDKTTPFGTGVVIDAERGYLLTAFHVINDADSIGVFAPARDGSGNLISESDYYTKREFPLIRRCDVIDTDPKRDLALLQIQYPSIDQKALPIARKSAKPGQVLSIIGNGASSDALWRFAAGNVRQIHADTYRFKDGQEIAAKVVSMTVPVNPGDSGGPILNQYGELVGITSCYRPKENQMQIGIDVTEIWSFLRKPGRPMTVTLIDAKVSDTGGANKKFYYVLSYLEDDKSTGKFVSDVTLAVDNAGQVTTIPAGRIAKAK